MNAYQIGKIPETPEARATLQRALIEYATKAVRDGTTKGLAKFLLSYQDEAFRNLLINWLIEYTPIRIPRNPTNHLVLCARDNLRKNYDLAGARLNNYWTMETPVQRPTVTTCPPAKASSNQLSEREFLKKTIKSALDTFLKESTDQSKQNLIQLITDFESRGKSSRQSPFVSGGLPSLGRRR